MGRTKRTHGDGHKKSEKFEMRGNGMDKLDLVAQMGFNLFASVKRSRSNFIINGAKNQQQRHIKKISFHTQNSHGA